MKEQTFAEELPLHKELEIALEDYMEKHYYPCRLQVSMINTHNRPTISIFASRENEPPRAKVEVEYNSWKMEEVVKALAEQLNEPTKSSHD